jgi:hypothetical protein
MIVFAFAMVTLLSCCSLVSCFYAVPRVTRSHDAIVIDCKIVFYNDKSFKFSLTLFF